MSVAVRAAVLCVCALLLQYANAELQGRCEANIKCPPRVTPCSTDNECGDKICCNTTCGRACVDGLLTGCENIKLSSERISRALAADNVRTGRGKLPSIRAPRCRTSDGEFEEIQCDNEIVSSCWCVDAAGFEIPGTRAPAAGLVNCTQVAPCAAHTCRMLCPLGFELDSKGCPICKCRDPCNQITCPNQLSCQLEEVPCLKPPCPPVPTCKRGRSLQNICPVGEPLLISETSRPFLCGTDPGKPDCPPLYKCLVDSGNDYGVCCPASLELTKVGTCPAPTGVDCGTPCAHDIECPSMQKCCDGGECGKHCTLPNNVTICRQQKMVAELLVVSEKEGRGYVPQCAPDGSFVSKQCSRNGLVCWCVDTEGNKVRGSMGPAMAVECGAAPLAALVRAGRRSTVACARALCAAVCEYGYKIDADGCPTCECDNPCAGFICPQTEECVVVKEAGCQGQLCTGLPMCRPRVPYENPCEIDVPARDADATVLSCSNDSDCPVGHNCVESKKSANVCCPDLHYIYNSTETDIMETGIDLCGTEAEVLCGLNSTKTCPEGDCENDLVCCGAVSCGPICVDPDKLRLQGDRVDSTPPTMCEYLRDFDEKMEGTVDGMKLALRAPKCTSDGSFKSQQCDDERCWCVDSFGTEIPDTSAANSSAELNCDKVRFELSCLDLTCRMGCDYGFELGPDRCPTCRCRDPCTGVTCPEGRTCNVVDVACDLEYCPPVPACLPKKTGQCPYLVPSKDVCEWTCKTDAECGANERCCPTGCGTACTTTVHQTACQQRRALALHTAAESGNPPAWTWVPKCNEDGTYETLQCRGSDNSCWCVDVAGNEISGTRTTGLVPNCDKPTNCEPPNCNDTMPCTFGHKLDSNGCPTCECRDLCAEANCKPDETCELVALECEDAVCPPLARCAPTPQCPNGVSPLLAPDKSGPLLCGPNAAACPSTHACRFAPHDSRPSVCCPKPRTVCFESKDKGSCDKNEFLNTTRWYFNHEHNRCERFTYHGCSGNHNNFKTKEECNIVCPVLSPCRRLREKNLAAAEKYGKGVFIPQCDNEYNWEPVQCMTHIDVCWCVTSKGEPLKGSLVRGGKPTCNFRQSRKYTVPDSSQVRTDEVLEELIRQMTEYREEEIEEFEETEGDKGDELDREGRDDVWYLESTIPAVQTRPADTIVTMDKATANSTEKIVHSESPEVSFQTKCEVMRIDLGVDETSYRPSCLADGSFSPRQCWKEECWCVDAAGQRRLSTRVIKGPPAPDPCEKTKIDSATIELEFMNVDLKDAELVKNSLAHHLSAVGALVPVNIEKDRSTLRIRAVIPGPQAADYVNHIEQIVKRDKLRNFKGPQRLYADVIHSEYHLAQTSASPALQQREILSESTVSIATSYHTALIVLAATSAFIISVLCVLVMLYRARLQREPHKAERFLPASPPVYRTYTSSISSDEKVELAKALRVPPLPVLLQSHEHRQTTTSSRT